MDYKELADLIFPNAKEISYYEELYPERNLSEGAKVTRFAPSPTGFVHIGSLFVSLIDKKLAKQSNGTFLLRVEDTDQKREVEGGVQGILDALKDFGLQVDEGVVSEKEEIGKYGPYLQSKRKEIYQAYAKDLISKGLAYPCFCTAEEIEEKRLTQENAKIRPGYYGVWAKCRNLGIDNMVEKINNGEKYIIRLKSPGREDKKIKHHDLIRGNIEFPENDQDIVIIKADGLPTYHFAHAIDDHLMKVTHVIRGDEWISSVPLHIQLFQVLGFKPPKYAHIAPLMKEEDGGKRKISKRKDPEAAVSYYHKEGIPEDAVTEYLLNIANSNFEEWRRANPEKSTDEFELALNKMGVSGALFDIVKLLDVSKNVISKYSKEKIYEDSLKWAKAYDAELKTVLENDKDYAIRILGIERGIEKPRKDIAKLSDIKYSMEYMYDDIFDKQSNYEFQKVSDEKEIKQILEKYVENYFDISDDKQMWFDKMKDLAEELGYAREVKLFKKEPEQYKGHIGDISMVLRVVITKRQNTPDLYEIMQILGKEKVQKRINNYLNK
ncbi:MAG: glutamate--tRNA ligase [Lachnospiraceae bacterium]|jgi:glutamyl-tRNA synthetase|nr:glutamate--tRNA ligase [Lachnospiraceae bacterium]